ncbi:unnamed protein product, partial [Symbiodinium sp. CCMP2456]
EGHEGRSLAIQWPGSPIEAPGHSPTAAISSSSPQAFAGSPAAASPGKIAAPLRDPLQTAQWPASPGEARSPSTGSVANGMQTSTSPVQAPASGTAHPRPWATGPSEASHPGIANGSPTASSPVQAGGPGQWPASPFQGASPAALSGSLAGQWPASPSEASAPETGLGQWPLQEASSVPRPSNNPAGQWPEMPAQ